MDYSRKNKNAINASQVSITMGVCNTLPKYMYNKLYHKPRGQLREALKSTEKCGPH